MVCFVDAAHFVHGPFLGHLWCFVRLLIHGPSGRKRFNVSGAINAVAGGDHGVPGGVEGEHRRSIKSLLMLDFQTFEEPQLLAG